jgi:predicted O-linked N-acetylglucosamine transferase (SPINDLY family)
LATPDIDFTPAGESQGTVTFGCFNNLAKLSHVTLQTWRTLLYEVPHARLLLKAGAFVEAEGRARMTRRLDELGLPMERVSLLPSLPYRDHLQLYRQIDIALDTFPYHGTTTTCEALWMGVPVITQVGETHISRVGASLLRQAGTEELITHDPAGYIQTAVTLAADSRRIRQYHLGLRERLKTSMLLNPGRFLQDFEKVILEMIHSRETV